MRHYHGYEESVIHLFPEVQFDKSKFVQLAGNKIRKKKEIKMKKEDKIGRCTEMTTFIQNAQGVRWKTEDNSLTT